MKTLAEVLWDAKRDKVVAKAPEKDINLIGINCMVICCGPVPTCAAGDKCK